ncbi:MAG: RNA polymerase sigma-70 factor (ECF subfamily) [Pseudohongiellaceae bacterium]|jgi:RNA polymerase sigma-70 factor (ECF subfamily)
MFDEVGLNRLYQYAMALCQQRDDAYDLMQTAIEKYLIELKCQRQIINNPEAFVRTLIRNRFIEQCRHDKRWDSDSYEETAAYDISPLTLEKICIDDDSVKQIWLLLSPLDRDIFYHWAVLGYSTDEACEKLGMARGTFLSRIHRLRKQLPKLLYNQSASNNGALGQEASP